MARRLAVTVAAAIVSLLCSSTTPAAEECTGSSDDCVAVGAWSLSVALGAGDRTNPLVHGSDIPLVVVPQFSYYGKRFFIDNLDAGVTLFEGDANTLSLVASPGYDRVFFYRRDLQNFFLSSTAGVGAGGGRGPDVGGQQPGQPASYVIETAAHHTPQVTYLAGPEWTFKHAGTVGQLDYLHEITGRDHGDEIRGALGVPLGRALGGAWSTRFGVTWKSAAVVNYYYGVPGVYRPRWALDPFLKVRYSRVLSSKWTFDAFVDYEYLGDSIASSPIVDSHSVTTAFLGATYVFHK